MELIAVGNVVWLKSGGPPMTVDALVENDGIIVTCKWFNGTDLLTCDFSEKSVSKTPPA